MRKMQGAKAEAKGSILRYVTEAECRKQHSSLCIMTHRLSFLGLVFRLHDFVSASCSDARAR